MGQRTFVDKLDFTTSLGDDVRVVVTDLGDVLAALVFARGLLRHQRTRIHLGDPGAAEDPTLVARRTDDGFLFDVRMQGEQATLFFAH